MLTCLWFRITRQAFTVEMFINQTFVTLFKIKTGTVNIVDRLAITTRCDVVAALWQAITSVVAVTPELIGNLEPQDEHLQIAEFALLQWWWNNVAIDAQPAANGFFQLVDIIALIKKLIWKSALSSNVLYLPNRAKQMRNRRYSPRHWNCTL